MNAHSPNPRAVLGDNNPPAPDPHEAISAHVADLMETARGFLDGEEISTQEVADKVSLLMDEARQAKKTADAARVAEKKPHDDAAKAVQSKWNPLIEQCDRAADVCKAALKPYLMAQEVEKRRKAEEARAEATRQAEEAQRAAREAHALDLAAQEAAEAQVKAAAKADTAAERAENDRGRAAGGARATTLRDNWVTTLTDAGVALKYYMGADPEGLKAWLLDRARVDVRNGRREIPGFTIANEPVVV